MRRADGRGLKPEKLSDSTHFRGRTRFRSYSIEEGRRKRSATRVSLFCGRGISFLDSRSTIAMKSS